MSDTTELCGSTYHGHTCRRPAGHRSDMKLIDREQCSARWGGGGITWRTEQAPPVAPEEAVRLVDALLHAADDKAPVFEKRRALLNYMDKQQAEIEETRESWRTVQKMYAALTAEKEAMQKVVAATERYLCTDSPSVRDKCKVWDALDALQKQRRQSAFDALTPKPPTDSTERKVE